MNDSTSERPEKHRPGDTPRKGVSRRGFIQKMSALGLASLSASAVLAGCGTDDGGDSSSRDPSTTASTDLECNDLSGLSESEKERRAAQVDALQYVEQTERPDQNCANCLFYQQPTGGSECGGCQLFPGPVHPNGWCTTWQAKAG
jgi:hypothetical protein